MCIRDSLKPQMWRFTHFRTPMPQTPHSPPNYTLPWTDPKPNYLPYPWTHPTYHPKPHPYLISRFATMHCTDRHTDQQMEGMFDEYRPLLVCGECRSLKLWMPGQFRCKCRQYRFNCASPWCYDQDKIGQTNFSCVTVSLQCQIHWLMNNTHFAVHSSCSKKQSSCDRYTDIDKNTPTRSLKYIHVKWIHKTCMK